MRMLRIVLLTICAFWITGCSRWGSKSIAESQRIGNEIIAAIAAYRSDNGALPKALDDLVPKYLPTVKPPTAGTRKWRYTVISDDTFMLVFYGDDAPEYPSSFFEWKNGNGHWSVDQ